MRRVAPSVLLILFLSAPLMAQQWQTRWEQSGSGPGVTFGSSVSRAGDVDGDGVDDFLVGAPKKAPGGVVDAGSVFLFSGATGTMIRRLDGGEVGQSLGAWGLCAAGDVDGDGCEDYAIGDARGGPVPNAWRGAVHLLSGKTGLCLQEWNGNADGDLFGTDVSLAGDINMDGVGDIIVGAPIAGTVSIFSGADGILIHQIAGLADPYGLGTSVTGLGDLDGDGVSEFAAGEPGATVGSNSGAGKAYIFLGASGTLLFTLSSGGQNDKFGWSLAAAGDVDGDGLGDVLVSAKDRFNGTLQNAGAVFVFSGRDGAMLREHLGQSSFEGLGVCVARAGDFNLDGRADYLAGAYAADPVGLLDAGAVLLFSGFDGSVLHVFAGEGEHDYFGVSADGDLDLNGDSYGEVLVGAFQPVWPAAAGGGRAYLFQFDPRFPLVVQGLSPGGVATISVSNCFPGARVYPAYSLRGTGPTTTSYGFTLELSQPIYQLPYMMVTASGIGWQTVGVPPSAPVGRSTWWQAVEVTSGPTFRTSTSSEVVIQ